MFEADNIRDWRDHDHGRGLGAGRALPQADQAGRRLRPGGTGNALNPVQDRALWKLKKPPRRSAGRGRILYTVEKPAAVLGLVSSCFSVSEVAAVSARR